jgi:hypothetical protein
VAAADECRLPPGSAPAYYLDIAGVLAAATGGRDHARVIQVACSLLGCLLPAPRTATGPPRCEAVLVTEAFSRVAQRRRDSERAGPASPAVAVASGAAVRVGVAGEACSGGPGSVIDATEARAPRTDSTVVEPRGEKPDGHHRDDDPQEHVVVHLPSKRTPGGVRLPWRSVVPSWCRHPQLCRRGSGGQ